jgi:excisionase family DNA binding protein
MATTKRDLTDPQVQGPLNQRKARRGNHDARLPKLLTVPELAQLLRVPTEYVTRRLVFERRIRFVKVGRRTLFHAADVENFLAERTVTPAE